MTTRAPRSTMSSRALRAAVAAGIVAAAMVVPPLGGPVDALEGDSLRFEAREGNELVYTHDIPMAPTDGGTISEPEECALVTWCTRIPIEIVPPAGERGDLDDWIVTVEVSWDNAEIHTDLAGGAEGNDLDVYMWHMGPAEDDEGNTEYDENGDPVMEYKETGRSASASMPEVLKLFRPEARNYDLVVLNFIGVNREFTVKITFFDASYVPDPLFDDTASVAPAAPASPASSPPSAPARAPSFSSPVSPTPAAPATPTAPELAPLGDDDFGFSGLTNFDQQLEADEGPIRGTLFDEVELGPPEPVSDSTVALWMGLLPLALLAGLAALLFKFRPAALSFQLPRRG
jgi:hypothetical protein